MKEEYIWGSYGPHAIWYPYVSWKPITELTTSHLVNILRTQFQLTVDYKNAIFKVLYTRGLTANHIVSMIRTMAYEQLKLTQ